MANAISAKTKDKLTKKELKEDKLVGYAFKAESYYHTHKNLILGIGGGIVVAVIAFFVIQSSLKSGQEQASYDMTLAKFYYGSGQYDQAQSAFDKIIKTYGGSAGGEAQYFLGRIAFEQTKFTEAEADFRKYLDQGEGDGFYDCAAWSGLAASQEAQGKSAEAAQTYEKVAETYPKLAYAPQALLEVSRIYLKLNQEDNAKKALKTIKDKYPDTAAAGEANKFLTNLE